MTINSRLKGRISCRGSLRNRESILLEGIQVYEGSEGIGNN